MKKLFFLFFMCFGGILVSQNSNKTTFKFDSIVSLEVPKNYFEADTLVDGVQIHQIRFKTSTYNFIAQKVLFEREDQKESLSRLPYNYASLLDEYDRVIARMRTRIPYTFKSKALVEKEGFQGYNLKFTNNKDSLAYETEFYLLNKNLYTFFYASETDYNSQVKDSIFNSIKINNNNSISQYLGKPPKYRIGYVISTYFFLLLIITGIIIYTVKLYRKKKTTP
ncbi:hypothetical protein KO566_03695 [Flavobacteriaceae bacterium XHP0103]|uniref:hypothetical protein n=1 Tax=Marixanthotalea marina TaxID=2844359 RepID=UPI002989D9F5|nr:hypothetical protein [Marixanthotalea marina]MBU3821153.1 hypothetical protein [Marixanthotalea marina]